MFEIRPPLNCDPVTTCKKAFFRVVMDPVIRKIESIIEGLVVCILIFTAVTTIVGSVVSYLEFKRSREFKKHIREMESQYSSLPSKDTQRIELLKEEIADQLDPTKPGERKFVQIREDWTKDAFKEYEQLSDKRSKALEFSRKRVSRALHMAEDAMRAEKEAREELERRIKQAEVAREVAAMTYGIYWQQKVKEVLVSAPTEEQAMNRV